MIKRIGDGDACGRCGRVTHLLTDEYGRTAEACWGCPGFKPGARPQPVEYESSGLRGKVDLAGLRATRLKNTPSRAEVAPRRKKEAPAVKVPKLRGPTRLRGTLKSRIYAPKRCACGATFTPTGPRALRCESCR